MITVRNLNKNYRTGKIVVPALTDVSFDVYENRFVSIVGPSGCGKSTLLHVLGGMLRATGGSVTVEGFDVTTASDGELTTFRRDRIGFVFQKFNLISSLSVYDNLRLACQISKKGNLWIERIETVLDALGVLRKRNAKPLELSQGEQQRVAIARALVKEPKLLLADEPTGNLDSENSVNTVRLFREISEVSGLTIVMITHNRALADMTDRVIDMVDGRTINTSDTAEAEGSIGNLPERTVVSEAKR